MKVVNLFPSKHNAVLFLLLSSAAGWAAAQSNARLYGIIDAGIRSFPNLAVSEERITGVDDGIRNRFGIRVKEDLGGGVSAFARLESSFRMDTGALRDSSKFWDDKAWVGLDSPIYGNIMIGRLRSPIDDMVSGTRFEAFGGYSLASSLSRYGKALDAWDNAAYYTSPNYSGFKAGMGIRMGEGVSRNSRGAHVEYTKGRVDIVASFQIDGETLSSDRTSYNVSGTYAFGFAKLFGTYVRTVDIGAKDSGRAYAATMGIQIPVWVGEFRASMRKSPNKFTNSLTDRSGDIDTTHAGIGYHYPLSKLTSINASLVQQTRKTYNAAGAVLTNRKGRGYDIGIRHYF